MSTRLESGGWSQPAGRGEPVDTTDQEHCPVVSPDGRYLFDLRRSGGRTHVWWVELGLTTRSTRSG